ncbi:hypothetical protein [Saccharicrinis aurantiacus]|uniref:hypothetical protein n=1 Tax=Saccharicrinis aurantiacus TaxID=1849719 RepID=UPI0008397B8E|nr:hypothetical protein [Saccharicrinis aurantiacus]
MKNILATIAIALIFIACESNENSIPDAVLVDVYQIQQYEKTDPDDENSPVELTATLNIYKTKDLVITTKGISTRSADITGREDLTDEESYNMSFDAIEVITEPEVIMWPLIDEEGEPVIGDDGEPVLVETEITVEASYNYTYNVNGEVKSEKGTAIINIKAVRTNLDYDFSEEETYTETISGKMHVTQVYN